MTPTAATTSKPVIKNHDMLALKAYVTAKDQTQYDAVDDSMLILDVTHSNLRQQHIEIRFSKHDTIANVRQRIHQKTGTSPGFQHLQFQSAGQVLLDIAPDTMDNYKLGAFGILHHGMVIHCIDTNPLSESRGGQYEDVSLVEKYVMTEEEYNKRKGTLRDWERTQKAKDSTFTLAKHAREHRELVEAQRQYKLKLPLPPNFQVDATGKVVRIEEDYDDCIIRGKENHPRDDVDNDDNDPLYGLESVDGIEIGQRCQVQPGKRRGEIAYVGKIPELKNGGGYWVGVRFDEPVGQNNGTTSSTSKQYFEANDKHGGFVRGKHVQVGDFPERDLLDESDEEEEDSEDEL